MASTTAINNGESLLFMPAKSTHNESENNHQKKKTKALMESNNII
jgi:hypothetical protein